MDGKYKYSYQTIEHFCKHKNPGDEIFFIIGMDSLNNIQNWVKSYELLGLCKFIIITRPTDKLIENKNLAKIQKKISFLLTI